MNRTGKYEYKKLGDVASITMGQSPKSDTYNKSEGLPFFQGNADFGEVHPNVRIFCNAPIRTADVDDILISVRAPIGAINIADRKCCIGRGLASLRVSVNCANRYILYFLKASKDKLIEQGTGSTFKSIGKDALFNLVIHVPPIEIQGCIVAELDLLQGIIDKQKAQLKEYDTLARSIFYDMFGDPVENGKGWDVKKMGEICNSELGKMLDAKKNTGEYREYLCTINVLWGSFDLTTIKRMRIEDDDIARYSVQKGDLLICEGGDTGRCAIWNRDENLCYQNSLHRVRFYSNIMLATVAQFVFHIMKERGELDKYCKGQTIKHLVKCALLTIPIPIPPLQLQQQFAEKIEAIEKQKAAINKSLAETQKLFDYTMDKYFG